MSERWTAEQFDAHLQKFRKTHGHVGAMGNTAVKSDETASHRPRKYRNQPVEFQGMKFDSKKEALTYQQLRIRETIGEISELQRQVVFPIYAINRATQILHVVMSYVADFQYIEDGKRVVVDVKGGKATQTPMYKAKKAFLAVQDGIEIVEV